MGESHLPQTDEPTKTFKRAPAIPAAFSAKKMEKIANMDSFDENTCRLSSPK